MRRGVLILLALVVLVPSMAHASAWYRCAQDGVTRPSCCCPPEAKHHKAPASDTAIRAACCCTITQITAGASSVRATPPIAIEMAPAVVPVAMVITQITAPARAVTIEHARAQRGPPESLFARFCSLLL